jgi:NitT/TauT family transport system ATP-binding protein
MSALMENGSFIRIDNVAKQFATPDGGIIPVVEPLSIDIEEGEFVVFVGPSGCGKTTVMRMVGGLETPSSGEIRLKGRRVEGPSREKGMVFQSYSSFPWLTVLGNIRFGLKYRIDVSAAEKERIARHYLDLVGLTPFADYTINRISGGMRQRVAIARTLAANPLVLLMDEPFGALDAFTRDEMNLLIQEIWMETGKTIVFVTHSISEAIFLADRVAVMSARPGRIAAIFDIDIPRPRPVDIQTKPDFIERVLKIKASIDHGRGPAEGLAIT